MHAHNYTKTDWRTIMLCYVNVNVVFGAFFFYSLKFMRLLVLTSALKFREKQICGAFLTFHTKIYLALLFLPCISGSSSKHLISMKTALVQMFIWPYWWPSFPAQESKHCHHVSSNMSWKEKQTRSGVQQCQAQRLVFCPWFGSIQDRIRIWEWLIM